MATTNEGAAGIVGAVACLEKAVSAASIKSLKKALAVLDVEYIGSIDIPIGEVIISVKQRVETEILRRAR